MLAIYVENSRFTYRPCVGIVFPCFLHKFNEVDRNQLDSVSWM